jgi:Bacteriophage lambda head decoration protein D
MPLIATDTYRLSHLLKQEIFPEHGYCREVVTVNEATAKTYAVGTLLGKVTANGKYKIAVQSAVDGSQNAAALVMQDQAIAATTDTKVLALVRGPSIVSKNAIVLDATYDLQAEKDLVYSQLTALGIVVADTI